MLFDGTGKLKGVKANGTCKVAGFEEDGAFTFECEGEYSTAAPAPAKKK